MLRILHQIARIPLRHLMMAFGMGAALGVGFWLWSRVLPVDYMSSALLSYEAPHQFLAEHSSAEAEVPTIRIADSVLNPPTLLKLADQVRFAASATRAEDFRSHFDLAQPAPGLLQVTYRGRDQKQVSAAANAAAGALSAWIAKPSQVTPTPVLPAAAPPVVSKAAPVVQQDAPAATPAPAQQLSANQRNDLKRRAAELRRRADVLDENVATCALQQHTIESQILKLNAEEKNLKHPQPPPSTETDLGDGTRQDLEAQLKVAKRRLRELRESYSPGYPDLEAAKEHVGALELRISALPASHPADSVQDASQSRLAAIAKSLGQLRQLRAGLAVDQDNGRREARDLREQAETAMQNADPSPAVSVSPPPSVPAAPAPAPAATRTADAATPAAEPLTSDDITQLAVSQGHFTVLSWAENSHPVPDDSRQILVWLGVAAAVALAGMYLALAAWRFRPVINLASLRDGLPGEVKYLGAISGSPLPENPS